MEKSSRIKRDFVGKSDYFPLWQFQNIWSMPKISFSLKKKVYDVSIVCDTTRDNYNHNDTQIFLKSIYILNLYDCMN